MHHHARLTRAFNVLFNEVQSVASLAIREFVGLIQWTTASHVERNLN